METTNSNKPLRRDVGNGAATITVKEKQRSRTGCRTCRSRKVKCDETPGGCQNCERLNLPCPNSPAYHHALAQGEPESDLLRTQAGLRRSRTYRSCRTCRSSKSRCSGERPTCLRCRNRSIECSYDGKQAPAWLEAASSSLERARRGSTEDEIHAFSSSDGARQDSQVVTPRSDENGTQSPDLLRNRSTSTASTKDTSWILAPELPNKERMIQLVEEYFLNVHNLRSFGFIHKPTLMQQLDDWSDVSYKDNTHNILLHVICALGAKFYAIKFCDECRDNDAFALSAGNQWARRAHQLLFMNLNNVSVESTMAVVLLHEHELRIGNYASAFMLTGLGIRMAQALQINLESSADVLCTDKTGLSPSSREARRRLMWSVYIMDAWVGSGVDELTLIGENDMKIQLPCNERSFDFQTPSIVEALEPGTYLPFISAEARMKGPLESLDLHAHFVRLVSLRRKVLRYVKHLDKAQPSWLPDSEFAMLEAAFQHWYNSLPGSLHFSRTAIYMRKESSQLGGLLFLHVTYHQTMCDLTRIGMRDLFKIRAAVEFPIEQTEFLKQVQDKCFEHCMALSSIYEEAMRYGPEALSDTWLSVVAHDSARVIVHYISNDLGTSAEKGENLKRLAVLALHANILALKKMIPIHSLAKPLYAAATQMLKKEGLSLPPSLDTKSLSDPSILQDSDRSTIGGSPVQYTPEYILNPLAIFRMARKDICDKEKHAPEGSCTGSSPEKPPIIPVTIEDMSPSPFPPVEILFGDSSQMDQFTRPDAIPDYQLPNSFDDLHAYLPLMSLNGFNLPVQDEFGSVPADGSMVDFADASVYPPPPPGPAGVFAPVSMAPDSFQSVTAGSTWPPQTM